MSKCDVILPVHNAEATLRSAVLSILGQTHADLRLIALDDGSGDGSLRILREFDDPRLVVVEGQVNSGLPSTLNHGIGLADAPYVARMDADDLAHPTRLERQIRVLESDPDLDLLGTAVICIDESDEILGWRSYPETHEELVSRPYRSIPLAHPTWCGRREWFVSNPYDPRALKAQDQALLRRALGHSRFGNLPEPLLAYREATAVRPLATLRSRRYIARDILGSSFSRGHYLRGLIGSAGVMSRWLVDLLVWVTGNPRLARHRFQSLSPEATSAWESILANRPLDGNTG